MAVDDLLRNEPQTPLDTRRRWSVEHQHYPGSVGMSGLFDERDAREIYGAYKERLEGQSDTYGVLRCDGRTVESWGDLVDASQEVTRG